jgi:small subunit ribosomal protein S1
MSNEFNWDALESKGFGDGYSQKEIAEMEALYDATLIQVADKQVLKGVVVGITDRDVILNIGFKSDGLVPLTEFRDVKDLKVGDEFEVYVESQEDKLGQLILSRKKARLVRAWENIEKALANDEILEGQVKRRTKGGLIIDLFGVEAFLPGSQIDVKPVRDFDVFVDKNIQVKVLKINYANDNIVVSHKVLIERDLEEQRQQILVNLEKGQVLEGTIKNITDFGAFIDLGGVDGLLHITDISWGRISHPSQMLQLDQKVNVVVLDFDENKRRISLGMKQLSAHPWDSLPEDLSVGTRVSGKIVNITDYGVFLELMPGVEGLIHVSEMSWSKHLKSPQELFKVGDEIEAVILTLDREERKMSLGIKQLTQDPWTKQDLLANYGVGTKHKGTVRNITDFGLFIELEEGIDGLVHISDLSWTKKIKHPNEFVKIGESLDVVVLEIDVENRRLALSHKHTEENPWETFATIFTIGSIHKGTVITKGDKFASVELPYGVEGTVALKNMKKEDGSFIEVGEQAEFKVLEFLADEKRITLSHTSVYKEDEEQSKKTTRKEPSKSEKEEANSSSMNQVEMPTMGDLAVLSNLKEKLEKDVESKKED